VLLLSGLLHGAACSKSYIAAIDRTDSGPALLDADPGNLQRFERSGDGPYDSHSGVEAATAVPTEMADSSVSPDASQPSDSSSVVGARRRRTDRNG